MNNLILDAEPRRDLWTQRDEDSSRYLVELFCKIKGDPSFRCRILCSRIGQEQSGMLFSSCEEFDS